jgi:hypothetical protein
MRHLRNRLLLTVAVLATLGIHMGLSQKASETKPLAAMSDSALYKKALADDAANKPDDAREAILVAIKKKKKPEKKYEDLLASVNNKLADREADAGAAACGKMDLQKCQKEIVAAKEFATTQRVSQLEETLKSILGKLQKEFQTAVAQADGGDPEGALDKLAGLKKYEAFLASLGSESERIRALFLQKLIREGNRFADEKNWEDASLRFQRVLAIAPQNESAKVGLDKANRGRKGYLVAVQAADQLEARQFEESLKLIREAIAAYPEGNDEFEPTQKKITEEWIKHLLQSIPSLIKIQEDLHNTREAYLRLLKVLELDPGNKEASKYIDATKPIFALNSAQYARQLAEIADLSRISTACVLEFNVQRLMPELVRQEELKGLMLNFNRKRISQLVLSVEDLASAAPDFIQSIQARTRSIIDKQALIDLHVRTKEDYEKAPNDDPQFQDLRPDGKSYTAILTVDISKYEFKRNSPDVTPDVKSRYVVGTEKVPNRDYEQLSAQLNAMRKALDDPRRKNKDKPTPEGWTTSLYALKEKELERTDKLIEKEKIVDYTYQKVGYKQNTSIDIEVILRDYFSKEIIAQDKIIHTDEREGVEISGVKDRDVNGLHNQTLRLPDKDQALSEGARIVREGLDKILPQILQAYMLRFFNEGERALKAGRPDEAAEAYLCHYAFFRGKLEPAQAEKISNIVMRETAFDLSKQGEKLIQQLLTVPVVQ